MGVIYRNSALYGGGTSDFDDLTNRPQESEPIDISELDLPMPAKPIEYPVLFDESGTEYQVGLYKRADGKAKPVYRKDFVLNSVTSDSATIPNSIIDNIEKVLGIEGAIVKADNGFTFQIPMCYGPYTNVYYSMCRYDTTGIYLQVGSIFVNNTSRVSISIEYTKTTDEWKEM